MVDLRQAISQDLIRFHIVRDSDRRCSYLFTNGICGQYTSIISRERMLCHISQSENDCNHGSGFEQRNKATRSVSDVLLSLPEPPLLPEYVHQSLHPALLLAEPADKQTSSYSEANEPVRLPFEKKSRNLDSSSTEVSHCQYRSRSCSISL